MIEEDVKKKAIDFARKNRKRIAQEPTDLKKYQSDPTPISVFMSGSPGAGKTEYSRNLIMLLEQFTEHYVIRIDSDEIRSYFPDYTGKNSRLFQGATALVVEKIHDYALEQKQTFILDGTFSRYDKAAKNIQRSLKKGRSVIIFYVYQEPKIAWEFTQAREAAEGRNIPKEAFIEQFLGAKETVERICREFASQVAIFLVRKNFQSNKVEYVERIEQGGRAVDDFIKEAYSKEALEKLL